MRARTDPRDPAPDFDGFLRRTGMSKAELSRRLGIDPKSSLVAAYVSGRAAPSYAMCARLLRAGMTVGELFGGEVWDLAKLRAFAECGDADALPDEACRRIVAAGLDAIRGG